MKRLRPLIDGSQLPLGVQNSEVQRGSGLLLEARNDREVFFVAAYQAVVFGGYIVDAVVAPRRGVELSHRIRRSLPLL